MGVGIFSQATSNRSMKPQAVLGEIQDGHQEEFLQRRVTRLWNGLPRETVESLSLELFKERLDVSLSAMVWFTRWCLVKGSTR